MCENKFIYHRIILKVNSFEMHTSVFLISRGGNNLCGKKNQAEERNNRKTIGVKKSKYEQYGAAEKKEKD